MAVHTAHTCNSNGSSNSQAPKDVAAKNAISVCQKVQILSKTLPQIPNFSKFHHLKKRLV